MTAWSVPGQPIHELTGNSRPEHKLQMTTIYSARWVLPISLSPIEGGAVAVDGNCIEAVGKATDVIEKFKGAMIKDFGNAAILPGLINTHSHLELTVMRGFLDREEHDFSTWLKKLTVARMGMSVEDLLVSAGCGAAEAARAGITCVADASSLAVPAVNALREVGLRGLVYQESFGPDPSQAQENVDKLKMQLDQARQAETNLVRAGVSPHAIYSVSPPQLELISRLALDEHLPLMMHAAESEAEELFVRDGSGPFAEGLQNRGIAWQAPRVSTIQHLVRHGILETKPLLAHCINTDEVDIATIKRFGAGVAHCPKSNAKLRHGRAPFARFVAASVNVGLGSDSVASNNTCDLLEEARFATLLARLDATPVSGELSPTGNLINAEQALFAATLGGARALGMDDQIGALAEGMQADLAIVGLSGTHQQPATNPAEAIVFTSSGRDVLLTMVAGKEVYRGGRVATIDETELMSRLQKVRSNLEAAPKPAV